MTGNVADLNGYGLVGLIVIVVAFVFIVVVLARVLRRDSGLRVARVGVFVEREQYGASDGELPEIETTEWPRRERDDPP